MDTGEHAHGIVENSKSCSGIVIRRILQREYIFFDRKDKYTIS